MYPGGVQGGVVYPGETTRARYKARDEGGARRSSPGDRPSPVRMYRVQDGQLLRLVPDSGRAPVVLPVHARYPAPGSQLSISQHVCWRAECWSPGLAAWHLLRRGLSGVVAGGRATREGCGQPARVPYGVLGDLAQVPGRNLAARKPDSPEVNSNVLWASRARFWALRARETHSGSPEC